MKPGMEKLQMWLVRETPAAVLVCDTCDAIRAPDARQLWLPRSLIDYLSKTAAPVGRLPAVEFTLPEWKINQSNLWDFVIN